MNKSNQITNDETINVQWAFWVAIIFTLVAFASFVLSLFLIFMFPVWQVFLLPVIAGISLTFDTFSVVLIRRGQAARALRILYWSILFVLPLNVLIFTGVTPILIGIVLTMGFVEVFLLFPPTWRKYLQFGPIVSVAVMGLIEFINPSFRFDMGLSPTTSYWGPAMLAFLVLGVIVLLVRQAMNGNIRTKLSTAFMVIAIFSVVVAGYSANRSLVSTLTTSIGNNLSELTSARSVDIGRTIDSELKTLKVLAINKAIQDAAAAASRGDPLSQADMDRLDQQWRAADLANSNADPLVAGVLNNQIASELREFRAQFPQQVELFLTSVQGVSIASTNRTSDYLQSDEEWWQTAYRDGLYIGQPEYDDSSKTIAMNMAVAVRQNGRIVGVLRTTVNFTALTDTLVAGLFGETGRTNIYLPDGSEIKLSATADGTYDLVQQEAPSAFQTLAQSTQKYQTITINEVPTIASSASVTMPGNTGSDAEIINNLNWRVVTLQDQAEAQQPIAAQTRNSTILAIVLITVVALAGRYLSGVISSPIVRLTGIAEKVAAGDMTAQAKVETRDEVGTLATTFNGMTARLREFIGTLESRVAERTQSLELAAEVGRSVSQVRALDFMLKDAAELIRSRFDLYYVQVYLTDPSQTNLILQSGTGTVGAELVGRGHRLPLDTASINGRATIEKRSIVVADTAASATFKPNPLLPDTRSEMAVPLLIGEKVVGVLDLQSQKAGQLDQDILTAFEALAGQLAIAIQNANLLAETEQARAEVETQARRLTRANWVDYMDAIHQPEETGFVFEQNKIAPLTGEEPVKDNALIAPIAIVGEGIGNLVVEMEEQSPIARTDELVHAVARQVAQHIESLRLVESAERYRAEAEEVSRRLTREGWKEYRQANVNESMSYIYDLKEVRPYHGNKHAEQAGLDLPLKIRDETIGRLTIQGIEAGDGDSLELASAIAERLSSHIENLRQFNATQRGQIELDKRARQLAAVAEISTVSSKELDIDKMLKSVVSLTQRQFGLYHAHVFTYNENKAELRIAACGWHEGDEHEGTQEDTVIALSQEQSLVARAARSKQAVIVNNVRNEPGWLPNPLLPETQSEMAVPLVIGDQVLGVLDVQSDQVNAFSEEDANIQTTLASQVATSLQNARLFAQAQQQAEREGMLNAISQKIQAATTVEAVLQIAARELGHALGAPLTIAQLGVK